MDQGAGHLQHVKGVLVADVLKCKWLQQRNCEVSGSSFDWPLEHGLTEQRTDDACLARAARCHGSILAHPDAPR